jgi:hypothetical protein
MPVMVLNSGYDFLGDIHAALGLNRDIRAATIRASIDSAVVVEVEFFLEEKDGKKVQEIMRRYHLARPDSDKPTK